MKKFYSFLCLFWCGLYLLNVPCFAQEISFAASVNTSKVSLGSVVELNLDFTGASNIAAPKLPEIEGFDSRYLGPASSISIINGKTSSSITHMYHLIPLKTGVFTIPSFSIDYKNKSYSTEPITIEVIKGSVRGSGSGAESSVISSEDLKNSIFLRLEVDKKIVYVNELIPVRLKLYIKDLSVGEVEYPDLNQEGFLVEPFDNYEKYRDVLNGVYYDVVEFPSTAFALRPGELLMGPARLKCNLLLQRGPSRRRSPFDDMDSFFSGFDSIFERYQRYPLEIVSNESAVFVKEPPAAGRPRDFNQSLGRYTFSLQADPKEVTVGDPITLRMIVSGRGNFKTVNPPELEFGDSFKIYAPKAEQTENSKMFEQVIIPKSENISQIPSISFSFFDPEKESYQTITKPPIPITVRKPEGRDKGRIDDYSIIGRPQEPSGQRDIIFIKEKIGDLRKQGAVLYTNPIFIIFQLIPLFVVIALFFYVQKIRRLRTDPRYARRLQAPAKAKKGLEEAYLCLRSNDAKKFFNSVSRTMLRYFSDKLHLPIGSVTSESLNEILAKRGVSEGVLESIAEILAKCDMARFAPLDFSRKDMEYVYKNMREIIDHIERRRI
jgi:hypothetical protein